LMSRHVVRRYDTRKEAIRHRRSGLLNRSVLLLHGNTRPHAATQFWD
jgi:hypothetical protein